MTGRYPTGRDDRYLDRCHDLRDEGNRSNRGVLRCRTLHPRRTMAASFGALRDDGVDPGLGDSARIIDSTHHRDDLCALRVESFHQRPRGIPKPDTEHGNALFQHHLDDCGDIVRPRYGARERWRKVEAFAKAVEDGLRTAHDGVRKPGGVDRRPDLRVKQEIHTKRFVR